MNMTNAVKQKQVPAGLPLLCTLENEGASGSPRDDQGCLR